MPRTLIEDGWYLVWSAIDSPDSVLAEIHRVVNGYDRVRGQKVALLIPNGWCYHPVIVMTQDQLKESLDRAYQAGMNGAVDLLAKIGEVANEREGDHQVSNDQGPNGTDSPETKVAGGRDA